MVDHIILAYALTGPRAGQALDGAAIAAEIESANLAWVHLDASKPDTRAWITGNLPSIAPPIVDALLAEETRPRATPHGAGLMVILRGINTNAGAEPEDMVSIRLWLDPERIVSMRIRRINAVQDIEARIRAGTGPADAGAFLATLAEQLTAGIEPVIGALDDESDALEERLALAADPDMRRPIASVRHRTVQLRRHIAPQREALATIRSTPPPWLHDADRTRIAETLDRLTRMIEDLDSIRERTQILKDEVSNALAEQLNRNMYVLSVIAALFLPLGFLTGLLGVNVAGIPGAETPGAFWAFSGLLALIVAAQIWLFRRMRWF